MTQENRHLVVPKPSPLYTKSWSYAVRDDNPKREQNFMPIKKDTF